MLSGKALLEWGKVATADVVSALEARVVELEKLVERVTSLETNKGKRELCLCLWLALGFIKNQKPISLSRPNLWLHKTIFLTFPPWRPTN